MDGNPMALLPRPTSIKAQMPVLADQLRQIAAQMGDEMVNTLVRNSIDLMKAYEADDYRAMSAVYRRKTGWINAHEDGVQLGLSTEQVQTFAQRHRSTYATN